MSTVEGIVDWIVGILVAVAAFFAALIRQSDLRKIDGLDKRIDSVEQKQADHDTACESRRGRLHDEIRELRRDVDRKHGELVALITGYIGGGKQ